MPRILSFFFLAWLPIGALSAALEKVLEKRIEHAQSGNFSVIEGGKMITVLSLRSITPASLILEEISIPSPKIKTHPASWADWVKAKAPGHTSWSMIEIDRATLEIIECYSFSKAAWIEIGKEESLITTLLDLELERVSPSDQRKIGPPPQAGEADHRKIWTPSLVLDGKKKNEVQFDVYQTIWPKDGSELSGHRVILYFDQDECIPFPCWIQIEATHANVAVRMIDSGTHLPSPHRSFPRKIPQFVGQPLKTPTGLRLCLKSPKYYRHFDIFAVDVTNKEREICPISHTVIQREADLITVELSREHLNQVLEPNHRYTWLVVPVGYTDSYTESARSFTWILDTPGASSQMPAHFR